MVRVLGTGFVSCQEVGAMPWKPVTGQIVFARLDGQVREVTVTAWDSYTGTVRVDWPPGASPRPSRAIGLRACGGPNSTRRATSRSTPSPSEPTQGMTLAPHGHPLVGFPLPTRLMATVVTGWAFQEDVEGFLPEPSGAILKEAHGRSPNHRDDSPSLGRELG